jgi:hypothetical protein
MSEEREFNELMTADKFEEARQLADSMLRSVYAQEGVYFKSVWLQFKAMACFEL